MRALLVVLAAGFATAATVDEIVRLSKAGVSDQTLVALIDRDKTVFDLDGSQVETLRREGVSQAVVLAMLQSGRQDAAQTEVLAEAVSGPDVVVVGHGPDRPGPPIVVTYVIPYFIPVAVFLSAPPLPCRMGTAAVPPASSTRGIFFAQQASSEGIFFRHGGANLAAGTVGLSNPPATGCSGVAVAPGQNVSR